MNQDNNKAHSQLRWILDNADMGFFIVAATHTQQRQIADAHKSPRIAEYDYSPRGGDFSFYELSQWADDNKDADILFILNTQVGLHDDHQIGAFNMSRDMLAKKERVWIFFMTADLEYRLSTFALDVYSYVRMKVHFKAGIEHIPERQDILDFHDRQSVQKIQAMLEQYKPLEEQLMALPLESTPDNQLLSAATTLYEIAFLYVDCADYDDALRLREKVLQIRKKILGDNHLGTAAVYNKVAYIYDMQGQYDNALKLYHKVLGIYEIHLGVEHLTTAHIYNNVAAVYGSKGDYAKALEFYYKALEIREKQLSVEHLDTATTYNNIATAYYNQDDSAQALEWYQKALDIYEKLLGVEHPDTAQIYNSMGATYDNQGHHAKALKLHHKALAIFEKLLGNDHPDAARTYYNIAGSYFNQGDYIRAFEWIIRAYRVFLRRLDSNHPMTIESLDIIKATHQHLGITEPFDKWLSQQLQD